MKQYTRPFASTGWCTTEGVLFFFDADRQRAGRSNLASTRPPGDRSSARPGRRVQKDGIIRRRTGARTSTGRRPGRRTGGGVDAARARRQAGRRAARRGDERRGDDIVGDDIGGGTCARTPIADIVQDRARANAQRTRIPKARSVTARRRRGPRSRENRGLLPFRRSRPARARSDWTRAGGRGGAATSFRRSGATRRTTSRRSRFPGTRPAWRCPRASATRRDRRPCRSRPGTIARTRRRALRGRRPRRRRAGARSRARRSARGALASTRGRRGGGVARRFATRSLRTRPISRSDASLLCGR